MGLATVAPSAQAPTHYLPTPGTGMLAACVGACVHVCVCAWLHGCVASQTEVRARHACMYDGCRPINQSTHTVSPCTGKAKACARHACACTMAAGQSIKAHTRQVLAQVKPKYVHVTPACSMAAGQSIKAHIHSKSLHRQNQNMCTSRLHVRWLQANQSKHTHTVSPCTGKAKACARHACACTMAAGQSWPGASMLCQHTSLHIDRKPVCSTYMASQHAVHTDSDVAPLYIEATRRARNKGAAVLCQHNFLHTHSKPACGTYTASRHAVHKAVTWHLCI
jgi:hypothetical protein